MTQLNHIVNKCQHNLRIGVSLRTVHQQMIVKRLQKTGMPKIVRKTWVISPCNFIKRDASIVIDVQVVSKTWLFL